MKFLILVFWTAVLCVGCWSCLFVVASFGTTTVKITAVDALTGKATVVLVVRDLKDDDTVLFEYDGQLWLLQNDCGFKCEPLPPGYEAWKKAEQEESNNWWDQARARQSQETLQRKKLGSPAVRTQE